MAKTPKKLLGIARKKKKTSRPESTEITLNINSYVTATWKLWCFCLSISQFVNIVELK